MVSTWCTLMIRSAGSLDGRPGKQHCLNTSLTPDVCQALHASSSSLQISNDIEKQASCLIRHAHLAASSTE